MMSYPSGTYPVAGPLNGIKIIAFEHAWAAPYGTMMLADMGADVVKVEPPGTGDHVRAWTRNDLDGLSPHFLAVNRNKRSIVLDLKSPEGLATAKRLIAEADAVVENFSPGVMRKLGLDYDTLTESHPDLVYCSVSGFGETGPYSDRRAYDLLIQAEGGLLSVTGTDEESPAKVGTAVVDVLAAMVAAFSVASALRGKEALGQGRYIDVSMLDVAASTMAFNIFSYGLSGVMPKPIGTAHPLLAPYEVYSTATTPVAIAILTEAHWATFCSVLEREDLCTQTEFATAPMRVSNRELLNEQLRPIFDKWDGPELVDTLAGAGLACASVNDVAAILEHPQLHDRDFFSEWNVRGHDLIAPGAPWRMTGNAKQPQDRLPADRPGQHAADILRDWIGADSAEIDDLSARGALG
ncbi:CaiB/BaiF CoA transferase family protein [Rhodococcus opacus]|uniref:CaiB/BaiF CoA transferase family protein n=1 Tax=Rhodococcus opacus TaxID=37919 RepID=UPI00155A6F47|nr:CoA transferase [Rhodococcus opacus]